MRRKWSLLFPLISVLFCFSAFSHAQNWSGVLDPSRAIDWSHAGVPGGIPPRTTFCATLNPGATVAQINSAISNCGTGQTVKLNAGTYNLDGGQATGGLVFNNKSNVTLRGAGADQTKLIFAGDTPCGGTHAAVCFINGGGYVGSGDTVANWTAGYAKGTTVITLSTVSGLSAGKYITLDQLDDANTDPFPSLWICEADNICTDEGASGGQRNNRAQMQFVKVVSIAGNNVTISPGLYMPNWRSGQSPQAWWLPTQVTQSGVEDLSIDWTNTDAQTSIGFFNAYECWVKGVRSIHIVGSGGSSGRNHVWLWTGAYNTIRDSYFYGTARALSTSYGIEHYLSGNNLVENNMFQRVAAPLMMNGGSEGSVVSYNHSWDNYWLIDTQSMSGQVWLHAGGNDMILFEGNDGQGWWSDDIHGTHVFNTVFRSHYDGIERADLTRTGQNTPFVARAFGRYFNAIGNVLGTDSKHTTYGSIYDLGAPNNPPISADPQVANTLMRWGNYDTGTDTARFQSAEVPSGLSQFANPVPGGQALPASFYLNAKPSFFGSIPWPAIGPDVTGGDISGVAGHANRIPARLCLENTAIDSAYGSSNIRVFSAASCYAGTPPPPPPDPPTGLSAVVQ